MSRVEVRTRDDEPGMPFRLEGRVHLTAREPDGTVAWEVDQPNVITDLGYRYFLNGWTRPYLFLFLSPNVIAAAAGRTSLPDLGDCYVTGAGGGMAFESIAGASITFDAPTLTRTYSYTFAAAGARRIGTVGMAMNAAPLSGSGGYVGGNSNIGVVDAACYTVIAPAKTVGGSQTVECLYRVTLVPIY